MLHSEAQKASLPLLHWRRLSLGIPCGKEELLIRERRDVGDMVGDELSRHLVTSCSNLYDKVDLDVLVLPTVPTYQWGSSLETAISAECSRWICIWSVDLSRAFWISRVFDWYDS